MFDEEQSCIDVDGVRHGIFSSWQDRVTGCQCSCQSVGTVLVSLCDDACEQKGDGASLLPQNDEPFASLVYKDPDDPGEKKQQPTKPDPKLSHPLGASKQHVFLYI